VCVDEPPAPVEIDDRQTVHVGMRLSIKGVQDGTHINDRLADRLAQVCRCITMCIYTIYIYI
jgi:hypothetical protein